MILFTLILTLVYGLALVAAVTLGNKNAIQTVVATTLLTAGLFLFQALMRREEVKANWPKYRADPPYMFMAWMFKPDDDPRSRLQFASDNFTDVMTTSLVQVFMEFLEPVFKVFKVFMNALEQSAQGLFNVRGILAKLYAKFAEIIDIFDRRFNSTFHALRMTFIRLFDSMQKSYAVGVASIFSGLSAINAALGFVDLIVTICIAILVVLVVMVIFLFFILWPFIPLILTVVGIIAATAFGGAVGGMASSFCFVPSTPIMTKDGNIPISEIPIGTVLANDAVVQGVMKFKAMAQTPLYELYGIQVSGSHIVYDGSPLHVRNHKDAKSIECTEEYVHCLITSNHRIPIQSTKGILEFADWEEIDTNELSRWNEYVYRHLNNDMEYVAPPQTNMASEAAFDSTVHIETPDGPVPITTMVPGMIVLSADNTPTTVTGVITIDCSQINTSVIPGISAGAWIHNESGWTQPRVYITPVKGNWHTLTTESGTFIVRINDRTYGVRDFTDVGSAEIESSYEWVLDALHTNFVGPK